MTERKQVSGYVSEEEHTTIKAKANAEDRSMSVWVAEACREKIEREGLEEAGQRYRIEQHLLGLVDDAADQAADRIVERVTAELDTEDSGVEPAEPGPDGTYDWGE
jgi:hypothetical protein